MNENKYIGDLILLKGLPGSGKKSLGKVILQTPNNEDPEILTNEDYYKENNLLQNINESDEKKAINHCQMKCAERMRHNISRIVVANNFVNDEEILPYIDMAKRYNYRIHSVIVEKLNTDN